MLSEGHRQGSLWDARTIAQLRHQEIIPSQQRLLERRRGDDKVLKEILVDKVDGYECKHNSIYPTHHHAHDGIRTIAPPTPVDFTADVEIINEGHYEKSPPRLNPEKKKKIKRGDHSKERPLTARCFWHCEHKSRIYDG